MEKLFKKAIKTRDHLNETYIEFAKNDFKEACIYIHNKKHALLRLMFAADEREIDGKFRIYAVFSNKDIDKFFIITMGLVEDQPEFSSITPDILAAHWYEREIKDMFGLTPKGHPDLRRLVLHEAFPLNTYPLRKDFSITGEELREWGEGFVKKEPYQHMKVEGEGVYEINVGPVHAGIIEPGNFRISALGETVFFLEPRFFYTHKGTEKQFEKLGFSEGLLLAERVSGTSSFSHSAAYCMAVERLMGIDIPEKAGAVRTLLLEMERLYNHIGDIGFLCAGTGIAVGYARGAAIKEALNQLNERITGSRYLRGINVIGGISRDVLLQKDDILTAMANTEKEYEGLLDLLLGNVSHIERLENAGVLSRDIAVKLGVTGVTAKASGIADDIRKTHPHLLYNRLEFDIDILEKGDVFARMMIRAAEARTSMSLIKVLLKGSYEGGLSAETKHIPAYGSAIGYAETPRGSVFYFVKSDKNGRPLRVKLRSPSYCNWPAVPFALHNNIVPDFPLCNKSFNLSYSGCDM